MKLLLDFLNIIVNAIVEGITEWLPISSTGHMMLLQHFWKFRSEEIFTREFLEVFNVVVQFGAILAVVTLYRKKLNPLSNKLKDTQKKRIWNIWLKVIIGCMPAGIVGVLFDDWFDEHLYNVPVVATMLILYGIGFIVLELFNRGKDEFRIEKMKELDYGTVILIGLFQILAIIPGTSRSGVTILGAMILGCSRSIAAEFTFYMAIPIMAGASGLKILKYLKEVAEGSASINAPQVLAMGIGMVVAYVVSLYAISYLMKFIKKKSFTGFGIYRIVLGILVLVLLTVFK
ncbi:MAG: undecaprenyl-diphosphate phosphatase [Lachnospiraceae bacterium]|nr:undecaprenyl-diphosphate phosphatase [Lachnospiraceae bacterium]